MKPFTDFTALVPAQRELQKNYHTLVSCVLPRPIAFVSTLSSTGVSNLAPFSFFNAVGSNPPAVMFCPGTKRDDTNKDTLNNVRDTGEFVVNVVPYSLRNAMNDTAYPYAAQVDEFEVAGLTPLPSRFVQPCRVAESPVHMECKRVQIVPIGHGPLSSNICIGEVLCFHIAADVLLPDGTVDVERIDLIGRLGKEGYATIRDRFILERPKPKE